MNIHRHADSTPALSNYGSDPVIAKSRIVSVGGWHWVLYRRPNSYAWRVLSRASKSFEKAQVLLVRNWTRQGLL